MTKLEEMTSTLDTLARWINTKNRKQDELDGLSYSNSRTLSHLYDSLESLEYVINYPRQDYKFNIHDGLKKSELEAADILLILLDFCYQNQIRIGKAVEELVKDYEENNTH